jgi:uncharacterized protein (TIGR03067 family)
MVTPVTGAVEVTPILQVFDPDLTSLQRRGTQAGVVELCPGRSPEAFDYEPTKVKGRPVRWKFPGIYLLEGDVFVACVGYRGERPTAFSAEAGSENELVIYKRVKR